MTIFHCFFNTIDQINYSFDNEYFLINNNSLYTCVTILLQISSTLTLYNMYKIVRIYMYIYIGYNMNILIICLPSLYREWRSNDLGLGDLQNYT